MRVGLEMVKWYNIEFKITNAMYHQNARFVEVRILLDGGANLEKTCEMYHQTRKHLLTAFSCP
jgi:hypothetical protein